MKHAIFLTSTMVRICAITSALLLADASASLPSTMKAGALTATPTWPIPEENLQELDIDVPTAGADEVLVQVSGSDVNPIDWKMIEYGLWQQANWTIPHVFGKGCAGHVVAVGDAVARLKVGDAVWANLASDGCYAQYVALPESITSLAPSKITIEEAGVMPLVSLTGLEAFQFAGAGTEKSFADRTILVLGGSGGTGHIGIQLAKAFGAEKVITTCGTSNVDFCSELGADTVIDYHEAEWSEVIPKLSVDVIYDTVAQAGNGDLAFDILRDGGVYVTLLDQSLASDEKAASRPSVRQHFFLTDSSDYRQLDIVREFVDAGKVRPFVETSFQVSEFGKAFNESMQGHTKGKISVVPSSKPSFVLV